MTGTWPIDMYVLIPAYRSAQSLSSLLPSLLKSVPSSNILIVDDASQDTTDSLCSTLGIPRISHQINKGKGASLATGFQELIKNNARFIITMDADGQHAISDLPVFLKAIEQHPESGIIIGYRDMKLNAMPFTRICSNRMTSAFLSFLTGVPVRDSQCGYRAYAAEFLKKIVIRFQRFEMESEVILKAKFAGYPIRFEKVQTLYCSEHSHIRHFTDTMRWIWAVLDVWVHKQ